MTVVPRPSETPGNPGPVIPGQPSPDVVGGVLVPAQFTGDLVGETGVGSGSRPFRQRALLVIARGLDPTAATGNGVNPVDVGLKTESSPILGVTGALWFGSNVSLSAVLSTSGRLVPANVDVAFVTAANGAIGVTLDGNVFGTPFARVNYLNMYNVETSLVAQIHNVLAGTVTATVAPDQQTVTAEFRLAGTSGFTGPTPTSHYTGVFTGTRVPPA